MEQPASSSKVTVEYFDPSSVYQLLSPGLLQRLPLRNLHWESHAGPLRSIKSIHIDLLPSEEARPLSSSSASDLSRVKSTESAASGDDGFRTQALGKASVDKERPDSRAGQPKGLVKGRRHQIPGLRQTPYLKVFLLRCDDNDTYKSQARKQVREWIKEHTPSTQSAARINTQENHDAHEWLILHVIVPNTAAATQARTSSKGSATIFEKLKADFNGTSRSAVDRVAQIRIGINDVPYDILPRVIPAIPGSYVETAQENIEAWEDLVKKFKSLILSSFDMRVTQYEEDIREKDAQRALPGWNFCTFFVLKEGLARGFESVGLVEDALVGYDELAVGLDAIIREQAVLGSGTEHGGSFLPYTKDLRELLERSRSAVLSDQGILSEDVDGPINLQSEDDGHDQDEIPLSSTKKLYRDLILANNISIFDFRCYLFARQLSLLLRLGNAWSSREELLAKLKEQLESSLRGVAARQVPSQPAEDTENLVILSEICRKALDFIAAISRIMREDLLAAERHRRQQARPEDKSEVLGVTIDPITVQLINNLVSTFTFSVAQQILAQTSTKSLPIPPSTLAPPSQKMAVPGQEPKAAIPEPKTMLHPARSTSLGVNTREPISPGLFPGGRPNGPEQNDASKSHSTFLKTGLEDLAAHRAELYVLSRSVLEQLGKQRGWLVGWNAIGDIQGGPGTMEDVDLGGDKSKEGHSQAEDVGPTLHGLNNRLLRTGLDDQDDFYRLYEILTDKALRHFTVANHIHSVQSKMVDLALLKYHLGDYAASSSYLLRMRPFYTDGGWDGIEMCVLAMHTKCLKELKQNEEYVRVSLNLLAKGAAVKKKWLDQKQALRTSAGSRFEIEESISVDGYLEELMKIIPKLQRETHVSLQTFFANVVAEGNVRYHDGRDSFELQLKICYLLSDELVIDNARARLVPVAGGQGRDIWLNRDESIIIRNGVTRLLFQSNVIIPGTYVIKQVVLHSSKMVLSYDSDATASQPLNHGAEFLKCPRLLLYQRPESFDVRLFASRYMHLDRNRFLEIELSSGWNDVLHGEIHVRAATAGLRLQTSDVKITNNEVEILKSSDPGVIRFGAMPSAHSVRALVPFTIEIEVNDIALKLEVSYTTDSGSYFFANNPSISIMLPLGVNVQDVFKHRALFSKFTISSATSSPLRLLSSKLEDSETFTATHGVGLRNPVMIFPRQPASLLYKITRRPTKTTSASVAGPRRKVKSMLSLTIHYICLEEEIDNAVKAVLSEALKNTPFHQYNRLVIPTVISQLHSRMSSYDLERTALLEELSATILSNINWRDFFSGLGKLDNQGKDTASLLNQWIQDWCLSNPSIPLRPIDISESTIAKSRSIIVPVDVPSVTVVHTADVKLLHQGTTITDNGSVVARTNEAISAILEIRWTRTWDTTPAPPDAVAGQNNLSFVYNISAPNDTWLLGGKRTGHFLIPTSKDAKSASPVLSFPLLMIPLRKGHLPFPHLEIKPQVLMRTMMHSPSPGGEAKSPLSPGGGEQGRRGSGNGGGGPGTGAGGITAAAGPEMEKITSETDYRNVAETICVISNAASTTLSLDASGPQGGAWLLDSECRVDGGDEGDDGGRGSVYGKGVKGEELLII